MYSVRNLFILTIYAFIPKKSRLFRNEGIDSRGFLHFPNVNLAAVMINSIWKFTNQELQHGCYTLFDSLYFHWKMFSMFLCQALKLVSNSAVFAAIMRFISGKTANSFSVITSSEQLLVGGLENFSICRSRAFPG